jgi:hypothetical protein
MAIKPLNERLDDLSGAEKAQAEMPMDNNSQETFELTTEPPQFEETQVAGIKDIAEIILKAPKRTKKPLVKEGESVSQVGPYQVIKEAPTQVTEQIVQEAPKMPVSGKPSAEPGIQETAFNLDLIKDEDGVKQFIESTARTYGADFYINADGRFDKIIEQWKKAGYDKSGTVEWINYYPDKHFDSNIVKQFEQFTNTICARAWVSKIRPGKYAPYHNDIDDKEEE